jgi:crossover junction endodeoxyribonuclease RuvC
MIQKLLSEKKVRILGVDPGLAHTGYGIIDYSLSRLFHVAHGVISTPPEMETGRRLLCIYARLAALIEEYAPAEAGIENLYFAKNITSALPVAQARGVAFLLFAQKSLTVGDYSPTVIKRAIVGSGRADKTQVQELVKLLLGLKELPRPDDAADALAAAICHAHMRKITARISAAGAAVNGAYRRTRRKVK